MRSPAWVLGFAVPIKLALPVCGLSPCAAGNPDIPIAVAAPGHESLAALRGAERFHKGVDRTPTLEEPE